MRCADVKADAFVEVGADYAALARPEEKRLTGVKGLKFACFISFSFLVRIWVEASMRELNSLPG